MGMEPVNFVKQTELPRMEKVMKNFVVYRWMEIAFIIAGLVLIFLFRLNPDRSFWYGLGIALAIQGALMLGADYFAEKRGEVYTEELKKIIVQ
jgi:membrane-bound ClpP family serine protease